MRDTFHSELSELREQLAAMCELAAEAMRRSGEALRTGDRELAAEVVAGDEVLDKARDRCDEHAQSLLALQAPVASDLRTVLAAVYCADKIERMGDLAAHIADAVRRHETGRPVPDELMETFAELGSVTAGMATRLVTLVRTPSADGFTELHRIDHTVDELHASVLATITGPGWQHGVRCGTGLALLARFYERYGDQAVSVAKRVAFAATGQTPSLARG
jgi:phosphate transport system protein